MLGDEDTLHVTPGNAQDGCVWRYSFLSATSHPWLPPVWVCAQQLHCQVTEKGAPITSFLMSLCDKDTDSGFSVGRFMSSL